MALNYHNCSCETSLPDSSEDDTKGFPASATVRATRMKTHAGLCGERLENAYVTWCQSLPLSYGNWYGMQNVCDICRECYEMCSCDVNSFPLRTTTSTYSVLRNLSPLRNSCRSLRRNYQESNVLSVCCFQNSVSRVQEMILDESIGSLRTTLKEGDSVTAVAGKFKTFDGNVEDTVSRNNPGILNRLLGNLMTMFSSDVSEDRKKILVGSTERGRDASSENISQTSEYQEYGTCDRPGKVRVFEGASCYSNITLNFYLMDSRKYWRYAEAVGVQHDFPSRVALVIVDVKVRRVFLSVGLSTCWSVRLPTYLFTRLSVHPWVHLPVHLSAHPFVCPPVSSPTYPPVRPPICPPASSPICPPVRLSVRQSFHVSPHQFVHPSVHLCVRPSVWLSSCVATCLHALLSFCYLPAFLPVCLISVYPFISLYAFLLVLTCNTIQVRVKYILNTSCFQTFCFLTPYLNPDTSWRELFLLEWSPVCSARRNGVNKHFNR